MRNNNAVSQIIGVIFLLGIAISLVSVIFTQVLSTPGPKDTTSVIIIGKIEENHPVFEIQRGESLGPETKLFINIAGSYNQSKYSLDQSFIQKYIHNQEWNIGERIILPPGNIPKDRGPRVEGKIVDSTTNSIVFWGILQEGIVTLHKGGIWHCDEPYWNRISDECKDSSGNKNHGTAILEANTTNIHKIKGYAGKFTGLIDDYIKVNTSWALNISRAITIEAWMRPQSTAEMDDFPSHRGITKFDSYGIYTNISGIAIGSINNVIVNVTDVPNIASEWHHFSLTYDGEKIILYVHDTDGNLIKKSSPKSYPNHLINETSSDLYIGRSYSGYIDEIAIYDEALSEEQIKDHIRDPGIFKWYLFG